MTEHLSSEQINKGMFGERTPAETRHLLECPECEAEMTRMEDALALFRSSVRNWTGQRAAYAIPGVSSLQRHSKTSPWRLPRLVFVSTVLVAALIVPVYWKSIERQQQAAAAADQLLLEEVSAQLIRVVPASMEQLVDLFPDSSLDNKGEGR